MLQEQMYLNIINNLSEGVYFVDKDRRITFWNAGAEKITGYSADEIVGKNCQGSGLNHIDDEGRPLCTVGCPLFATIIDGRQRRETVFVRHKDGYRLPITVNIFPVKEDGEIIGAIEIFNRNSPVVYEDALVEHLEGIAMHDALTSLPNRRYIESFLKYRMDEYENFGKQFAVLFADIDDFRKFNNEYGHDCGDRVLKNIAETLQKTVRKNDMVGRWGGEEMLGIYDITKSFDAVILAEKFRKMVMNTQVPFKDESLSVTVSVGVTTPVQGDTIESIVERADKLMYESKQAGKNRVTSG